MAVIDRAIGVVMVRSQPDMCRQHDLLRVAADVRAVRSEYVALAGELLRRTANEVPVLGILRGDAQRALLAAAADADRRGGRFRGPPRVFGGPLLAGDFPRRRG